MPVIRVMTMTITANSPAGMPMTADSVNLMATTNITTATMAANSTSQLIPSR